MSKLAVFAVLIVVSSNVTDFTSVLRAAKRDFLRLLFTYRYTLSCFAVSSSVLNRRLRRPREELMLLVLDDNESDEIILLVRLLKRVDVLEKLDVLARLDRLDRLA